MSRIQRFQGFAVACLLMSVTAPCVLAQRDGDDVPTGPWISSVAWLNNSEVVGTKSQGLLLRPAQLVKARVDALDKLETMGETETSLWDVLPLPDGRVVVSDYRGGIHIFGQGDPLRFDADLKWVRAMVLSPDGKQILAGTEDGKLVVLALESLKEARRVDAHQAAIFDITFNAAGDRIATACGDGTIKLFSWPKLEEQGVLTRGPEGVWAVLFTEDGKQLISGGSDRRIQLWDLESMQSAGTIAKSRDWVTALVALPKTTIVIASSMNGHLVAVDYALMQGVEDVEVANSAIWDAALSPDASKVLLGTRKSGFVLFAVPDWSAKVKEIAAKVAELQPPAPE